MLATGSDTSVPQIPGLAEAGFWTNREATTLNELPESVVVLGGGPVGIELGQFLRRFGARVTIVEMADRLLPREEAAVGEIIGDALREDGIELRLGAGTREVAQTDRGRTVRLDDGSELDAEQLLVAVGRTPRVGGIGLETVGIHPSPSGIDIDERCRSSA